MKMKIGTIRNAGLIALSVGTAYGLGVISCVWWELKFISKCCTTDEKNK